MNKSNNFIASLADELGDIRAQIKRLEAREKDIVADIKIELKSGDVALGSMWAIEAASVTTHPLDTPKVRAFLGDRVKEFETVKTCLRLTAKPAAYFVEAAE